MMRHDIITSQRSKDENNHREDPSPSVESQGKYAQESKGIDNHHSFHIPFH
jgi:hypothetical protein